MEKTEIPNTLGLTVYINGRPNLNNIPKDKFDEIIAVLYSSLDEWLKQNIFDG